MLSISTSIYHTLTTVVQSAVTIQRMSSAYDHTLACADIHKGYARHTTCVFQLRTSVYVFSDAEAKLSLFALVKIVQRMQAYTSIYVLPTLTIRKTYARDAGHM